MVLGLAVAGTVTTIALRHTLVSELDRQLALTLPALTSRVQFDAAMSGPSDYVVMVFAADGAELGTVIGDGHDPDSVPAIAELTPGETRDRAGQAFTVDSTAGGGRWRCVAALLRGPGGNQSVVLALPTNLVDDTTRRTALLVAWLTLAVTALATAIGYAMVRRSLWPLRNVERAAAEIAGGNLATRMPPARTGTEVGHLTDSLNAMLTQIEAAFATQSASEARMRAFVSDASHELRTPLAAIRGYAELYRMGGLEQAEALAVALRRIEDAAADMGVLVGDLSTLARLGQAQALRQRAVDLLGLAADAVADAKAIDPGRPVTLLEPAQAPGPVWADESALRRILTNLLANAVRHTPPGSAVEVLVSQPTASEAMVEVRDHGPGIPPEKRQQVFDRFFRLDDSRSRDRGGSGLGLAIVAGLVAAHGGGVDVIETPGGGATFRVVLPLAPEAASAD
ncbi:MAG: HAMP domain-containing histidine kinase [Bifidobacteriaceae bacterium]|nr:HAMP domain-containing histidine kinase [Bifidobacteriaceae bacterium]